MCIYMHIEIVHVSNQAFIISCQNCSCEEVSYVHIYTHRDCACEIRTLRNGKLK
jgi:hypothetical protein